VAGLDPHEPDASNDGCHLHALPDERPGIDVAMLNDARNNKLLPC
jgi:hypothetical protein